MKIFVINLKKAEKRRKNIEGQLKSLKLKYELVEAVDGIALGKEKMSQYIEKKLIDSLPAGHLACGLSHYFMYKRIVEEDIHQALILEDDILLSSELPAILTYFDKHPLKTLDVILLHMQVMYGTKLLKENCIKLTKDRSVYYMKPPEGGVGSTAAYIITRDVAKNKLKDFPISLKVDSWIPMMRKGIFEYLRCIYPYPVTPALFPSDINYINENSLKHKIKQVANNLPIVSKLLKSQRKKAWDSRQKNIEFSNDALLPASELFK